MDKQGMEWKKKIVVDLPKQPDSPRFGGNILGDDLKISEAKKKEEKKGLESQGKHGKSHHGYLKEMFQHEAVQPRAITLAELSEHKSKDSAWVSLQGMVYDVTTYLHYHPGGDILLQGCGKECESLFSIPSLNRQVSSVGEWEVFASEVRVRLSHQVIIRGTLRTSKRETSPFWVLCGALFVG